MMYLRTIFFATTLPMLNPTLANASATQTSVTSFGTDVPVEIAGDEFDSARVARAPRRELNSSYSFQVVASKSARGKPKVAALVQVNQVHAAEVNSGQVASVTYKGSQSAHPEVGDLESRGCIRDACFYKQTVVVNFSDLQIKSIDVIPITFKVLNTSGMSQIFEISAVDVKAVLKAALTM